ncbi:adenylate/guanylate cyclase domain-containing protein [Arcanobacterium haemolyticum]|uniref:Adenylate/guanylate cyclase n=1 Tax=Arcanobacterium haemolyticum (strain ATCC 9345 / DSM 20595 / CCM 5947 / CCUG 17215 / LMG 16163 / NBRC 15585 / NCTC 8452 / 11018) TaxID=644284 RepID=D7BKF2_ARCHD|nr:adenylate/guanylate cyclase domain-containing protein [Arcanobacterium haemolyticum]ADH93132.1 adenylate/guanylate cyclase [Arcanobacterium haemolyticum DSM 20595]SPT75295.1 pH-sensitive adenylate cyclase Rv1264 [Arcanobacterium haemolyticum]SQH28111.1 pH-sensitive adenylate cyclase Rv1264 [Arcanobacterium haemolyticum]
MQDTPGFGSDEELTTVEKHARRLLGGAPKYAIHQAAELAGMDVDSVRRFWRAMGFPYIRNSESVLFTEYDIDVMRAHQDFIERGKMDEDTQNSLVRAQSHLADRIVLWQYEALVEEAENRFGLDEVSARYWVLDHIQDYEQFLIYQTKYAWRRHLTAFLRRTEVELEGMSYNGANVMPLTRAMGFVDLVSFTQRSGELSPHQLVDFIQTFEFTSRDVISAYGARVVKTVGDAVLYIADDLDVGATVVSEIVNALHKTPGMPDVRASLVWGGLVSRFGDVFGPNVNLASRLCSIAPVGGILVDRPTAEALKKLDDKAYLIEPFGSPDLQGIGSIDAAQLHVVRQEM